VRVFGLLILLSLSLVSFPVKSEPATGEWMGHLARLSSAKVACRNTDSRACQPFLAEAVALANLINKLAYLDMDASKAHSPTPWKLAAPNGHTLSCTDALLQQMNGESLLHATLAQDFRDYQGKADDMYWTDALYSVVANDFCSRSR
jgi:hypothetical protein